MEPLAPHGSMSLRRGVILSEDRSGDMPRPMGLSGSRARPISTQMDMEEEIADSE